MRYGPRNEVGAGAEKAGVHVASGVFSEADQRIFRLRVGRSETVRDFQFSYLRAKEGHVFLRCFVGDDEDEVHVG